MNEKMKKKWRKTELTGEPVHVGREVTCDLCGADHTDTPDDGGAIVGESALCPACVARCEARKEAQGYGRGTVTFFAKAMARPGERFGDFVRRYREESGTGDTIRVMGMLPNAKGAILVDMVSLIGIALLGALAAVALTLAVMG